MDELRDKIIKRQKSIIEREENVIEKQENIILKLQEYANRQDRHIVILTITLIISLIINGLYYNNII